MNYKNILPGFTADTSQSFFYSKSSETTIVAKDTNAVSPQFKRQTFGTNRLPGGLNLTWCGFACDAAEAACMLGCDVTNPFAIAACTFACGQLGKHCNDGC